MEDHRVLRAAPLTLPLIIPTAAFLAANPRNVLR